MSQKPLRIWQTLSRTPLLTLGKFLTVESHTVKLPDGQVIPDWAWLTIPSAAIVLPCTPEGRFLVFRQTKYAVEGTSLAPVGGMLEPDESPQDAAKRELLEEMGCEAEDWVNLGSYILDPNRGIATMHLFLALNARQVAVPDSDDLEDQEMLSLSREELQTALSAGEFKILAWAACVSMALGYLDSSENGKKG